MTVGEMHAALFFVWSLAAWVFFLRLAQRRGSRG